VGVFTLDVTDGPRGSGVAAVRCKLDGVHDWIPCASPARCGVVIQVTIDTSETWGAGGVESISYYPTRRDKLGGRTTRGERSFLIPHSMKGCREETWVMVNTLKVDQPERWSNP
jgi:hypothetical protein